MIFEYFSHDCGHSKIWQWIEQTKIRFLMFANIFSEVKSLKILCLKKEMWNLFLVWRFSRSRVNFCENIYCEFQKNVKLLKNDLRILRISCKFQFSSWNLNFFYFLLNEKIVKNFGSFKNWEKKPKQNLQKLNFQIIQIDNLKISNLNRSKPNC